GILIPAAQSPAECIPALQLGHAGLASQSAPALAQKIGNEAEVISLRRFADFGHVPTGQVAVDAVHERRVVPHFGRHWAEQVADPLLVGHVHLEVADHYNAAVCPDALLAAAELAGLHVPLHYVHAVLLVEGNAAHFIEANHVVLAHQATLAGVI